MGRAFEFRKARKMKRWGQMAKTFTRIGKDIAMAVKSGGPDPTTNSRLRALIQNAKAANMPKDNVERAIKKASSKEQEDYKEVVYEGYGPYGIAIVVETATDNPTRTVASVRSYFTRSGGSLGTSGSLDFLFERKCIFKIKSREDIDIEELELELIDFGADEIGADENEIVIYGAFDAYGKIQHFLEEKGYEVISSDFERIPTDAKELTEEQEAEIEKLLGKFEEDDDVQNVFHNMK
ncbi:YebC/PmpR family DNA-binding transcriptional regulator [Sporocytophaga myxococcoides]|uniref:YebC/PmpR family DNA-binding transcriptional regulator n=1 Tax=Sporocytophaga myxococcoides TaxID=153721 RepID=UPI0003FD71AA|nr:YebC/PmpR family DNA-binding transcriptional regulator [Sporocytophaga myxococcoides]